MQLYGWDTPLWLITTPTHPPKKPKKTTTTTTTKRALSDLYYYLSQGRYLIHICIVKKELKSAYVHTHNCLSNYKAVRPKTGVNHASGTTENMTDHNV